jgi:DNA mismatch repair protein MutL
MRRMIRVLDGDTINKIAAGEVIERPANALKELLENSADSGATKIEIDFDGGGKKELKVTDDGCGIPADEVALAFERHATSKISSINDLEILHTFGFRGEALSSLAAVSELDLHTSLHETDSGTKIKAHGGKITSPKPAPALKGTQVVVKNIFFNVPARQKFLKSDAGETAAIKKVVRAFTLIHPELNITLKQGGKIIGHWERETFKKRAQRVLSVNDEESIYIKTKDGDMKLEAVIVLPQLSLNTQSGISLFVQGRPVADKTMQQAVMEGYRSLLMQHQYPQGVISLELDPRNVDINVHPAKAQVKFLSPGTIFRFISYEIKRALLEKMKPVDNNDEVGFLKEVQSSFIEDAVTHYNQRSLDQTGPVEQKSFSENYVQKIPERAAEEVSAAGIWSSVQVIGQYANTYIIGQSRNSLVLIDQHAAHERVLFERLKKSWSDGNIETQGALFDDTITLSREAIEALTAPEMTDVFKKLGFEIADRGPTTLGISQRPAFLIDIGLQPLFEKLSEQVLEVNSISNIQDVLNDLWASMSCHGAIRAGRVLSSEEMKALLLQMDEFSFSHFCPHGRPVSVNWDLYDLEKLFRRIV